MATKYIVYATTDNGRGYTGAIGEYEDLNDIKIYVGLFDNDVVIEIEEKTE